MKVWYGDAGAQKFDQEFEETIYWCSSVAIHSDAYISVQMDLDHVANSVTHMHSRILVSRRATVNRLQHRVLVKHHLCNHLPQRMAPAGFATLTRAVNEALASYVPKPIECHRVLSDRGVSALPVLGMQPHPLLIHPATLATNDRTLFSLSVWHT